jgi:hypothetical protein
MWIGDEVDQGYPYRACAGCGQGYRVGESDAERGALFCSTACETHHFHANDEDLILGGMEGRGRGTYDSEAADPQ